MSDLLPLQKLIFFPAAVPTPNTGDRGELVWLPLSKLRVDHSYQRAILDNGKANIRRMVEGFSWQLFSAIVVARRPGGVYAIIDGQHRATAALNHGGIREVPCLIVTGGVEAEARAFSAINSNVTRVLLQQAFRAKVTAGDTTAVALVNLIAKAKVTIAGFPTMVTMLKPGETNAIGALKKCSRLYGEKILLTALEALRSMDAGAGLTAPAIVGACQTLNQRPEFQATAVNLAGKIAAPGKLADLEQKARLRKEQRGGLLTGNFCAIFTDALVMAQRTGGQDMKRLMAGR